MDFDIIRRVLHLDMDGLQVSVATPKTLYLMKKGTVRPKDWGDAAALRLG